MSLKKLWVSYAWADNLSQDVDYILSQITELGIEVQFDRKSIIPGHHIWADIASTISDRDKCDAWALVVTNNSLASKPCRDEIYLAFEQVLNRRGNDFPMIGLLH